MSLDLMFKGVFRTNKRGRYFTVPFQLVPLLSANVRYTVRIRADQLDLKPRAKKPNAKSNHPARGFHPNKKSL